MAYVLHHEFKLETEQGGAIRVTGSIDESQTIRPLGLSVTIPTQTESFTLSAERIARLVQALKDTRDPGDELIAYRLNSLP